jgi:hypothetical protein
MAKEKEVEKTEREVRWDAFLVKAEEYARKEGMLDRFNTQKERGEFDTIPESFK